MECSFFAWKLDHLNQHNVLVLELSGMLAVRSCGLPWLGDLERIFQIRRWDKKNNLMY